MLVVETQKFLKKKKLGIGFLLSNFHIFERFFSRYFVKFTTIIGVHNNLRVKLMFAKLEPRWAYHKQEDLSPQTTIQIKTFDAIRMKQSSCTRIL